MGEVKYLIAVPCMDSMPTPFVASLTCMKRVGIVRHSFLSGSLVYDARNLLAKEALNTGADRILWLDSDMFFGPDLMQRMAEDLDEGRDFVSGLYFRRRLPTIPLIYDRVEIVDNAGKMVGQTHSFEDYPKGDIFPIAGCGFGAVMMTTKLLKDVCDNYDYPFEPLAGILGEDLTFCLRAKEAGYQLYCDSRLSIGHVGHLVYSEPHYLSQINTQK